MASPDPSAPPPLRPSSSDSSAIDFLSLCHLLKTTERTGWVRRGVRKAESVADPMYRMGIMSLVFEDGPGINRDRCVKMALVHDIAEAKEIGELWMEYEEDSSSETKLVKDFDKVEMILQALEYEDEQGIDQEEFFESTAGKFQADVGEVVSRRKQGK